MKSPKVRIPDLEHVRMMRSSGMTEKMAVEKLANMKRSKGSKGPEVAAKSSREDYPYGLRIDLDHEGMKKLGMHKMPKVGSKHQLHAHAHVVSASESHHDGDSKPTRSVAMQITHMAVGKQAQKNDSQGNGLEDQ
jgi:hypothetical protein